MSGRAAGPAPDGICHAVAIGADKTVCGIRVETLIAFEEEPWGPGRGMQLCGNCESIISR